MCPLNTESKNFCVRTFLSFLATFADSRFCDFMRFSCWFEDICLNQEVKTMAMLSRSNSLLYLGRVQKYRDLNNLAINFGPLAQIISTMPWIMSSKPLSRPGGMKGQFCKTSNFYQAAMHLWNCQRQEIIQSISTAAVNTCYFILNERDKRLHSKSLKNRSQGWF